jgi:hypothetical protein
MTARCRFAQCLAEVILDNEDLRYRRMYDELELGWTCEHCGYFAKLTVLSDPYLESVKAMAFFINNRATWYGCGVRMPFSEATIVRVLTDWTASATYKEGDRRSRGLFRLLGEAELLGIDATVIEALQEHNPAASNRELLRVASSLERANA